MPEETLLYVARLSNGLTPPEAIWLDMGAMRFVVVPVTAVGEAEPAATSVEDYLTSYPDRAEGVREALRTRFAPPPVVPGGGAAFLARRQRVDAEALVRGVTPENRHPETETGPAVGKEVW